MTETLVHVGGDAVSLTGATEFLSSVDWVRRDDALRVCGIGKDVLDRWVSDEKVEAHKLFPGRNGTVVFSAADISRAIRQSPRYYPSRCVG